MTAPPLSGISLLPALSVVLGLPLCLHSSSSDVTVGVGDNESGNNGNDNRNNSPSDCETLAVAPTKIKTSQQHKEDLFAERAKNNASRIYARRVINRARLERQHPWADSGSARGNRRNHDDGQSSSSNKSKSDEADDNGKFQKWKEEILSETLVSLIKLQEQISKVKSFKSSMESKSSNHVNFLFGDNNSNLLRQLGITNGNFLPTNYNNIAYCESSITSSKQRTLNEYNSLPNPSSAVNQSDKPAEWSDDSIDLVQRRLDFGKEISPLSNTTRFQRWWMAYKRMVTLGMLAAPLGVMIPVNVVLGNVVGGGKTNKKSGEEGKGIQQPQAENSSTATAEEQSSQTTKASALQRYHQTLTKATWDYALWAIETAGPTYIKLVQWASTRNDLFTPEFVGHFSKLQDETRGHTWHETTMTLERAYGKDWKKIISFDRQISDEDEESDGEEGGRLKRKGALANRERQKRLERSSSSSSSSSALPTVPIGSGCVAQVYKARLCSSHGLHPAGTSVAVKVQHPRILEKVCLDFYIMNKLASILEHIPYLNLDYLSMKDSVDQFRDIMLPQLDLRVEAHNLQRFRRDFEGQSQIAFPEPLMSLTSREVLVERFVEGEPMLNYVLKEDEHHSKKDREELATIGLKTVMEMIFLHDFVHADLHPGNMIVDRNKAIRGNPLRVHMIDCGLTVELGEHDHVNLVKILGSLIKRDGYGAGALMVGTATKCQGTELDVELFCKGIEKICVDDGENNFLESVGDYITDICYLACKHKVKLEAAFINAALACEIMEGLASSLYPDMKVQSVALPMVLKAEMMHGLKGLPSPKFWSSK